MANITKGEIAAHVSEYIETMIGAYTFEDNRNGSEIHPLSAIHFTGGEGIAHNHYSINGT